MFHCPIRSGEINSEPHLAGGKSQRAFRSGRTSNFDYLQPIYYLIFHIHVRFFQVSVQNLIYFTVSLLSLPSEVFAIAQARPRLHPVSWTFLSPPYFFCPVTSSSRKPGILVVHRRKFSQEDGRPFTRDNVVQSYSVYPNSYITSISYAVRIMCRASAPDASSTILETTYSRNLVQ
jgi:hypothetical protein